MVKMKFDIQTHDRLIKRRLIGIFNGRGGGKAIAPEMDNGKLGSATTTQFL